MNYDNTGVLAYMQALNAAGWTSWANDFASNPVTAMTSRLTVPQLFQDSLAMLPQDNINDTVVGMNRCAATLAAGGSLDLSTDIQSFGGTILNSTGYSITISFEWRRFNPVITDFKIKHYVNN